MTCNNCRVQPKAYLGGRPDFKEGEQPVALVPWENFERFINDPEGGITVNKKTAKGVRSMVGNVYKDHQNMILRKMT